MSTKEIDRIGEQMIRDLGCIPNFLNYGGFPASFCISLNDEVVHGIPSEEKIIQEGDLVKIDAGLIYKGIILMQRGLMLSVKFHRRHVS